MRKACLMLVAGIVAAWSVSQASAQEVSEEDLARLRAEIARLERELDRQIGRRDDRMAELRGIEESLAETRTRLASLAEAISAQSERRDRIESEREAAAGRLGNEQAALSDQVRFSYVSGQQGAVRLMLSQESPADLGRMLVYFDYLNQHRNERIAAVNAELAELERLAIESEAVAVELSRLRADELAQAERLEQERRARAELVSELNAGIASSEQRIEKMRADEAHLNDVIARLAELLESFPDSTAAAFSEQRGNLAWPVDGEIVARFGDARDSAGRVRWNGVLIEADAGGDVRAFYHGRVMHAQWTPGMGLLTILEHGDGFMTIYGHNAVLYKEVGDWVAPGEAIAEVGDTGGQQGAALYFEVRRDGEPVNPADWVR
ncbi:MAG TPA: peptidoglycan DD-metalloendopeptidase family protein [Gammaproteobacteria bacterium]